MPTYVYRCLDCGLSLDVYHSFEETYQDDCNGCGGVVRKHFGSVHIAASATPTRGVHDGKEIEKKKHIWQPIHDSDLKAFTPRLLTVLRTSNLVPVTNGKLKQGISLKKRIVRKLNLRYRRSSNEHTSMG